MLHLDENRLQILLKSLAGFLFTQIMALNQCYVVFQGLFSTVNKNNIWSVTICQTITDYLTWSYHVPCDKEWRSHVTLFILFQAANEAWHQGVGTAGAVPVGRSPGSVGWLQGARDGSVDAWNEEDMVDAKMYCRTHNITELFQLSEETNIRERWKARCSHKGEVGWRVQLLELIFEVWN